MFAHINHEEITQLPMDHSGMSYVDESMSNQMHGVIK